MTISLRVYEISPVYLKRRGGFTMEVGDEFISIPLLLLTLNLKNWPILCQWNIGMWPELQ